MRNEFDLLVVGGGFSGFVSALVAAERGKKVAVLARGAGSLIIGGGVVDLLGYDKDKKPVNKPFDAIQNLPANHPYSLLGEEKVKEAIRYFKERTAENGYPYESYEDQNSWIPTAVGNVKPTFLRPPSMNPDLVKECEHIVVAGVAGLKDFYPKLMIKGLSRQPVFRHKMYSAVFLDSPYENGRDLSAFDISSYVNRPGGTKWLMEQFKKHIPKGAVALVPPMFGTKPSMTVREQVRQELGIVCMETSVMPPSITGIRVHSLLMEGLKKHGVELIELAVVTRADVEGKRCRAVYTRAPDMERRYSASDYIIATGGFFGGGCVAAPGKAWERIFNIDLHAPAVQEEWSSPRLFGGEPHLFSSMGVKVDKNLNPLDEGGEPMLENVKFVGRTLGGYDLAAEKSGNGVALVTAYCAGLSVSGGGYGKTSSFAG